MARGNQWALPGNRTWPSVVPPTFVHYDIDGEDVCVGEFHYGSASDSKVLPAGKVSNSSLLITYNLGFDYGEVSDNQPEEDYHQMMEDILESCYDAGDDDAHMFIIHCPQDLAKMWPRLTKKWRFHQWINWNYPANIGQPEMDERWSSYIMAGPREPNSMERGLSNPTESTS